jgi:hypothetical protein
LPVELGVCWSIAQCGGLVHSPWAASAPTT